MVEYSLDSQSSDTMVPQPSPSKSMAVGVIVIGRNEGARLQAALRSVLNQSTSCLYVDSGSTDGSIEVAESLGVTVHQLCPTSPFTAARARREGVDVLLKSYPEIEAVHFLDGDCTLEDGWIEAAGSALREDDCVAIVCGRIVEAHPEDSLYNQLSPLMWDAPIGKIDACGGIFTVSRDVYLAVGGFNPELVTREESDLCARIRESGSDVIRIDLPMARHDSGLHTFAEWWTRALWGGFGDARGVCSQWGSRKSRDLLIWYLTRPIGMSALFVAGVIGAIWSPWSLLLALLMCLIQVASVLRVARARRQQGDTLRHAIAFGVFSPIRDWACGVGFVRFFISHLGIGSQPDPHAVQQAAEE